jgi:membrane associated rhomboid family serine protease
MDLYGRRYQLGFGGSLTPVVRDLLIANAAIFLLSRFLPVKQFIEPLFALHPSQVTHNLAVWQLATYMFLHGGWFHILFNMFTLWMFGCDVESEFGSKKFLQYYFITGIGAGLFNVLFAWNADIAIIGASGAIYGVLVAFAVLFPDRVITLLLFFILPVSVKAKYLVAIFIGISLFSSIQGQVFGVSDGVAHLAHLGGALVGLIMLKGNAITALVSREIRYRQLQWRTDKTRRRDDEIRVKREQVDRILDRINEVGYDGISQTEKETLKKASEFLSRE